MVIHKIKGLYDQGRGLSVRTISRELGISRNTVRKHLHQDKAKGRMIKNNHHYRDQAQRITDLERSIEAILPDDLGAALCQLLKRTSPRIYKDQLVAVRDLLMDHAPIDATLLGELCERSELTATGLRRYLEAWQQTRLRGSASSVTVSMHRRRVAALAMPI